MILGLVRAGLKKMAMVIPSWSGLRRLGANRLVRSASIWAVIVPIAAKLMEKIEDIAYVELFGEVFELHLSLPFSWKVLFLAAMAFLFANVIYGMFCPPLIKETESYRDFTEQKRSGTELGAIFRKLNDKKQIDAETANQWIGWYNARINPFILQDAPKDHDDSASREAYAQAVQAESQTLWGVRALATAFYAVGLLSFAVLALQNIAFVWRHL